MEHFLIISLFIMGTAAFYVAWNKNWGEYPIGKIAIIGFGILLLIGHFSLKNNKLSKQIEALNFKIQQLSKNLDTAKKVNF